MKRSAFFVLAVLLFAAPASAEPVLTATFIGNEAFAVTDGTVTLVSDFPYQSGYSLYMEYDPAVLEIRGDVVALITHRHADHFDVKLFAERDWKIIGPREITDGISKSRVVKRLARPRPLLSHPPRYSVYANYAYGDIMAHAFRTPHSNTEHYSYLVEWHGRKLYFFGDVEDPITFLTATAELGEFDVVFMTPWVLRPLLADGTDIPAKLIVIYHQQVGEALPQCGKCRALAQGESFTLD